MTTEDHTLSILSQIPGGRELLDWLGNADFGDSEVVGIRLDREGHSELRLSVSRPVNETGTYENAEVVFHLSGMIDIEIQGFLHQNVIGGLSIKHADQHRTIHPSLHGLGGALPAHLIELEPCAGAFGAIWATIASIALVPTE